MESNQIKRLPVVREGRVVGILSRANLLRALACLLRDAKSAHASDASIRRNLLTELENQKWAPVIDVIVRNGVVHLWGTLTEERQRQGVRVLAENTPGVKRVEDHLVWVEPISGVVLPSAEYFKAIGQVS